MPIAKLLLVALGIFVTIIVAGALIGALINLIQCLFFAAIAAIGAAVAIRLLARRALPASKQTIDHPGLSKNSTTDADQVSTQIQKRIERLRRDDTDRH